MEPARGLMFRLPDEKLKELLLKEKVIAAEDFESSLKEAQRLEGSVADVLISRGLVPRYYIAQVVANYLGVAPAALGDRQLDPATIKLLPEDLARQKRVVVFGRESDGFLSVAMEDPSDLNIAQFLENYLKAKVKPYLASEEDLNKAFSLYGQLTALSFKKVIEENINASTRGKIKSEAEAAQDVPIVAIVDNILSYALSLRASDIHLEIFEGFILVRYRVDGILHEILRIPKEIHPAIAARIKLLAGLKIDEHYKPQDGRFRYQIAGDTVDIRVAVMPTFSGEKVEMRLLAATNKPLSFTELGMLEGTIKSLEENIKKSYGMVLVCGPTGSGKTTTLYAVLGVLNRPEVNIITIEDPIEYNVQYINQTQVNPAAGITFASGLRAILRQDPNIVLVGEIRDSETAGIAVQASLTGHLVLSTLHTNDAPTAVPRLFDMDIQPFLVAAVLNAVLSQRLVRKIHLDCIESYEPDEPTLKLIREQLTEVGLTPEEIEASLPTRFYRGKGCAADNFTGYAGRLGIFEILNVSEEIRKLIIDPSFSLDNLKVQARREGMISMFEDGLRKVGRGITTIDEVLRVIQE
ncbi:MAG: type II/IV secretion system protein [Candidatus Colwellbacteria bacterium]|nr:type II/IV secretion system protein [Candidatus Colwellbacteria bacterium]